MLLFVDNSRYLNDSHSEFGKSICICICICICVTEQMMSNRVLAQIFLMLWTLNPGTASSCSAV